MQEAAPEKKYVRELFQLFVERGMEMTVEQVAERLHVTKKTLYNHFESKRAMADSVIRYFVAGVERKIAVSRRPGDDAIVQLLRASRIVPREIARLKFAFLNGILGQYKEFFTFSDPEGFYYRMVRENLLLGMKSGLYRKDADIGALLLSHTAVLDYIYDRNNIARYYNRAGGYFAEFVKAYLFSVVNDENRKLLSSYLEKV